MSLAAEAEVGALYINCRVAIPACQTLEFMGHPQHPTPMQMDNTTALGVINNNVIKKLKAMDMKYIWLHDRESLGQFQHYWAPGKENNGNYVTNIMPPFITKQHTQLSSQTSLPYKHYANDSQAIFL
jgi:hypothetical protein